MSDPLDTERQSVASTIEAQHRDIREVLEALEATDDVRMAVTLLDELDAMLRPHFAEEERPGGMLDFITTASQGRVAASIRRDHVELGRLSAEAIGAARACLAGPVAEVLTLVRDLSERIKSHERREGDAFMDALYVEAGGSE